MQLCSGQNSSVHVEAVQDNRFQIIGDLLEERLANKSCLSLVCATPELVAEAGLGVRLAPLSYGRDLPCEGPTIDFNLQARRFDQQDGVVCDVGKVLI